MNESFTSLHRQLIRELEALRIAAGLRQMDIAAALHVSPAKIARILSTNRPMVPSYVDLAAIVVFLKADQETGDRIENLGIELRKRKVSPFAQFRDILTPDEIAFYDAMTGAPHVLISQLSTIPTPHQTPEYRLGLLGANGRAGAHSSRRWDLEAALLTHLLKDDADTTWIIGEEALWRADPEHITMMITGYKDAPFRILPFSAGYIGASLAPFFLLEWDDDPDHEMTMFADQLPTLELVMVKDHQMPRALAAAGARKQAALDWVASFEFLTAHAKQRARRRA